MFVNCKIVHPGGLTHFMQTRTVQGKVLRSMISCTTVAVENLALKKFEAKAARQIGSVPAAPMYHPPVEPKTSPQVKLHPGGKSKAICGAKWSKSCQVNPHYCEDSDSEELSNCRCRWPGPLQSGGQVHLQGASRESAQSSVAQKETICIWKIWI